MPDEMQGARPLQVLVAGGLYTPEEIEGPVALVLDGGKISAIWRETDAPLARRRIDELVPGSQVDLRDLRSWRLAPGYIDLHIHGFQGHDITSGSQEDMEAVARGLPYSGTTAFFPTIATIGREETLRQVQRGVQVAGQQGREPAAEILGLRLEGPFISRAKKGAQYEPAIRRPDPAEMEELAAAGGGWLRIVDFAPEEDANGALLATLVRLGLLASIGHTAATYEQTMRALDGGARHATHLFNGMSAFAHREPGAPGALLTDRRASLEIIADGIHLHPAALKLAVAARGIDSVALVTDSVVAAGLPDGEYEFVNRRVVVREGAVRLTSGSLAGSTLTLDRAVRTMVSLAGLSWSEAICMATRTPARIAGVDARKGSLTPGADADLVALDEHGFVQCTWVRGRPVRQK